MVQHQSLILNNILLNVANYNGRTCLPLLLQTPLNFEL